MPDPRPADNEAVAVLDAAFSDPVVEKGVDNARPTIGDRITFNVTVRNAGAGRASGVQLSDTLGPGLTFVSATPSQGTIDSALGRWNVGTLNGGAVATLSLVADVTGLEPTSNTAQASSRNGLEASLANNRAVVAVTPQQPDVVIEKAAGQPTAVVGGSVTWTVTVRNAGGGRATGVVVVDGLPPGLAVESASAGQGTFDPASGSWNVGELAPGAATTLQLITRVTGVGTLNNIARVIQLVQRNANLDNHVATASVLAEDAIDPTAVTLVRFAVLEVDGAVVVEWDTATEVGTRLFRVFRSERGQREGATLVAQVPARGIGGRGASYRVVDRTAPAGIASTYLLEEQDTAGRSTLIASAQLRPFRVLLPVQGR